jgi:outer membrane protein TolC
MKSLLLWISLSVLGSSAVRAEDPPAGPLDVDAAVRLALNQNYVYRRAQAGVGIAEGNRLDALAGILPNASGDYSYQKQSSTTTLKGLDLVTTSVDFGPETVTRQGSLDLDQTQEASGFGVFLREDLSFTNWYRYRSAQAGVSQARYGRDAAAQDLAFQVRQQFYLVLRAQDLLKVQEEDLRLAQDQERRTTSMFELGSVARVDVLKAKVRVSDAEVALIRQQNQVDIEKSHLAVLLGLGAAATIELAGELKADVAIPDSAAAATESVKRADLESARENLRSANNLHRAARWSRIPGLFATFDYNINSGNSESDNINRQTIVDVNTPGPGDTTLTNVLYTFPVKSDLDFDGWNLRVGATVSLDAFLNTGQEKRTRGIAHQAEYDLKGLELDVQRQVEEAVLNTRAAMKSIDAAQRGVESSEEDQRLSQERYQQGLGTVLELLESQVNLTRARDTLVNALTVLKISEAALDKARGASLPY